MFEDIQNYREEVAQNIAKSFSSDLEKGGVYADTYENRKLGRVGQSYGRSGSKKDDVSKKKVTNFGDHAKVIHDGGDKYFTTKSPYYTKEEFLKELKSYLKQEGGKFDASRIKVKKTLGYDHAIHKQYYYEIAGSVEGKEEDPFVQRQEKYKEWLKTNKTASQLMGHKYSAEKILQNATKEEREILRNTRDDLEYEETRAKIAKRILGQ